MTTLPRPSWETMGESGENIVVHLCLHLLSLDLSPRSRRCVILFVEIKDKTKKLFVPFTLGSLGGDCLAE